MENGNTRLVGEGGESFREKEGGWRPLEEKKGLRVTWEGGRVCLISFIFIQLLSGPTGPWQLLVPFLSFLFLVPPFCSRPQRTIPRLGGVLSS